MGRITLLNLILLGKRMLMCLGRIRHIPYSQALQQQQQVQADWFPLRLLANQQGTFVQPGEWSIPTGTIYNGSTAISVKPSTVDGEYNIYLVALFPGTTSQSVGPSASGTINFGSAFNVPYITIDQYGRITALANRSMILSGALASSSAPGLCPKLDSGHPSYYLNANGTWSAPRGRVYGVKGKAETAYREGQVNITAANVGALPITGGTVSGATTFSDTVTLSTAGSITYDDGFYDG